MGDRLTAPAGGWTHCLYCGYPLRSEVAMRDGFGASCYVKLERGERTRLVAAAVAAIELEGVKRWTEYSWLERLRLRLGLVRLH